MIFPALKLNILLTRFRIRLTDFLHFRPLSEIEYV